MGERGRIVHVRGPGGAALPDAVIGSFARLAANRRWTSLVPLDNPDFDIAALAAAVRADVVQVWFDDDLGVVLQFAGADGFAGELSILFGAADGPGAEDRGFLDAIVRRKMLTATAARDLRSGPPTGAGRDHRRAEAGYRAGVIRACARARHRARARRGRLDGAAAPPLSVARRGKKHLPAAARHLVDELVDAIALGKSDEIPSRVEYVLSRTWDAEDWAAFVRNPKLDDDGLGDSALRRWQQMTGRG